jgi:hypothetical protein
MRRDHEGLSAGGGELPVEARSPDRPLEIRKGRHPELGAQADESPERRWRCRDTVRYAGVRVRIRSLTPLLVAGLALAYLLAYPLAIGKADESHLLYAAKRVLQGEVLYRDVFETITPLSFYLFAAVYRIAGTTLLAARVTMAVIEAVGCALLFHLVRRVAGVPEAVLVALLFVSVCIPAWQYASPHWISTVLGLLLATVTLSHASVASSRVRSMVAGMLAGVAVCVQQQRGVFLAAWLPLAFAVLARSAARGERWRAFVSQTAWGAAGGAVVVLAVIGHAAWMSSPAAVIDALYRFAAKYYPADFRQIPWATALPLTQPWSATTWITLLRVSPLFLVGEGLLLARARATPDRRDLERACLWLLAALMALSIWYLPDFIHVSFVLPFLMIPGASVLHALRSAALWERFPLGRRIVTAGTWLCAVGVLGQGIANVAYARAIAPVRLETAFGPIRADAAMARLLGAVQAHVVREPDGRSLLYSYPDDAWLYLTVPADDATPYSIMLASFPPERVREVADRLRARGAGTVVVFVPLAADSIPQVVPEGYDLVEEVGQYRIYVRRAVADRSVHG